MKLEDAVEIDAPADLVWSVTIDVENWPQWTPTVTSVSKCDDSAFQLGSVVSIKQPMMPKTSWEVKEWIEGERFAWETRVCGMRMVATHELQPLDSRTQNVLRLEVTGFLATLLRPVLRTPLRSALQQENNGLKQYCEKLNAG